MPWERGEIAEAEVGLGEFITAVVASDVEAERTKQHKTTQNNDDRCAPKTEPETESNNHEDHE